MSAIVDIEKTLGSFHLEVQLEAKDETMALLGASGCGKSLTLKCIAGIEKPDRGHIEVDGVTLFDSAKGINLSPQKRRTGLMFQNYALFPNMTVLDNIRAGARREPDKLKREKLVREYIDLFGLAEHTNHYPSQLSGGQQQRTALARILVSDPRILLLDEPFSALDSHLRFRLEEELRRTIRDFGRTVIFVSHDRDEVYRLSDSVAIMNNGRIDVMGGLKQVFASPGTREAATLTGCKNISPIEKLSTDRVLATAWGIELECSKPLTGAEYIGIRAHDIAPGEGENTFSCAVTEEIENPFSITVMLQAESGKDSIAMELDKDAWRAVRANTLSVNIPKDAILVLRKGGKE